MTPSQEKAIQQRGANLIVSAAAGSGKTTVMIQRILDCILREQIPIDELLVVTFTRAAAQDMKERARRELTRALESGELSEEQTDFIRKQLLMLDEASFSTIHTFCSTLLKRYYPMMNLDPDYMIISGGESETMLDECYRDITEEVLQERDPRIMEVFRLFWSTRNDNVFPMVKSILNFCNDQPEGLDWLCGGIRQLRSAAERPLRSVWAEHILRDLRLRYRDALQRTADDLLATYLADSDGGRHSLKTKNDPAEEMTFVQAMVQQCRDVAVALDANDLTLAVASVKKLENPFSRLHKDKTMVNEIVATLQGGKDGLLTKIGGYAGFADADTQRQAMENTADILEGFWLLTDRVQTAFAERKRRSAKLEYNDLEHYALRLLEMDTVCRDVKDSYRYVFVDEYQDVSRIQETIIRRVSREDNLFCVGDLKQSIYGFRNADPGIFVERMQSAGAIGSQSSQQLQTLAENFRSHPGIIEAVNLFLQHIMRLDPAMSPYRDEDAMKASAYRPDTEADSGVAYCPIVSEKGENYQEKQSAVIAREILQLVGTPLWDSKTKTYRNLEYRDIAVLASKWAPISHIQEYFRRWGIPTISSAEDRVFAHVESKVLVDCLQWVDDPAEDVCLTNVLHSDMVGLSAEEMYRIRQYSPAEQTFSAACQRYMKDMEDGVAIRLRRFFSMAAEWRRLAPVEPCHRLILRVLEETGFIHTVSGYADGETKAAALRTLVGKAKKMGDSGAVGLYRFLRYVEREAEDGSAEKPALSESTNAVRLYTFHGSKGLEFPVVFLANLQDSLIKADRQLGKLVLNSKLGPALQTNSGGLLLEDTLVLKGIHAYQERFEHAESLRLLYVAMTRAREKLYMVGESVSAAKNSLLVRPITYLTMHQGLTTYMYLLQALALRMPGGETLTDVPMEDGTFEKKVSFPWNIRVIDIPTEELLGDIASLQPEKGEKAVAALQYGVHPEAFLWQYPYHEEISVPGTLAATGLLRSVYPEQTEPQTLRARPLEGIRKKKKDIKATDIGTWVHGVMERMRPGMAAADVLRDMVEGGILPPEAGELVHTEDIDRIMQDPALLEANAAHTILREQPFLLRIPACEADPLRYAGCNTPVMVQGIIDLAYAAEDGWVLLDYKSNIVRDAEDIDHLLEYYAPQARIYRMALERITGKPVRKAGLALIHTGRVVWFPKE